MPIASDAWTEVGRSQFALLTTYRRSGDGVSVPVWIAADSDDLVLTSERATGKIKRLRATARVDLQPCGRFGQVAPDSHPVGGVARISGSHADDRSAVAALARKYGLLFRVLLPVENLIRRLQRRPGDRVIIRIRAADDNTR